MKSYACNYADERERLALWSQMVVLVLAYVDFARWFFWYSWADKEAGIK